MTGVAFFQKVQIDQRGEIGRQRGGLHAQGAGDLAQLVVAVRNGANDGEIAVGGLHLVFQQEVWLLIEKTVFR